MIVKLWRASNRYNKYSLNFAVLQFVQSEDMPILRAVGFCRAAGLRAREARRGIQDEG